MSDRCQLGPGVPNSAGYCQEWAEGKRWLSHRLAWTLEYGEIPAGHDIHHLCGEPRCVNVEHLEALPHGEHTALHNTRRAA